MKIKPMVYVKSQGTHLEYMRTPIIFCYHLICRMHPPFLYKTMWCRNICHSWPQLWAIAYFSVFFAVCKRMLNFLHVILVLSHRTMDMHTTLNVELNLLSWSLFSQGQIWLLVFCK